MVETLPNTLAYMWQLKNIVAVRFVDEIKYLL